MSDLTETIKLIRGHHRKRRFAMKLQQKVERSLESFIRLNGTIWNPNAPGEEREKANSEVKEIIKRIRAGEPHELDEAVRTADGARAPADEMRADNERLMARTAKTLPVYPWVESIRGAGALGLATIVAECGDLSNYSNPAKIWKRLGFAPYDGLAGSTWKRVSWRPRALTAEEWIANPFSGERYALMHQIAVWLVNAQWIGKAKSDTGEGKPDGPYGQVYADRRAHTLETHPDWTDGHRRMDAVRVAMKAFLKDLHNEWRGIPPVKAAPKPKPKQPKRGAAREHVAAE